VKPRPTALSRFVSTRTDPSIVRADWRSPSKSKGFAVVCQVTTYNTRTSLIFLLQTVLPTQFHHGCCILVTCEPSPFAPLQLYPAYRHLPNSARRIAFPSPSTLQHLRLTPNANDCIYLSSQSRNDYPPAAPRRATLGGCESSHSLVFCQIITTIFSTAESKSTTTTPFHEHHYPLDFSTVLHHAFHHSSTPSSVRKLIGDPVALIVLGIRPQTDD
jgi:hypothetical protein